jgi:hypothetical protein
MSTSGSFQPTHGRRLSCRRIKPFLDGEREQIERVLEQVGGTAAAAVARNELALSLSMARSFNVQH